MVLLLLPIHFIQPVCVTLKTTKNLVTCWIGPANNNTNIASAANLNSPPVSVHSRDKSRQMLVKIALDNN